MAAIAGEVLTWEEGGVLFTQVRTNADMGKFRARLQARGLEDFVQALEGCFDRTRLHGGNAYLVVWRAGTLTADIREALAGF